MAKPNTRPNYPTEDAQAAKRTGVELLTATLGYLAAPEGSDESKDLASYVEAVETALAALEGVDIPQKWNAVVPKDVLDVFGRVDAAAESVMTTLRVDDETGRIHGPLEEFRQFCRRAAQDPPAEPYPM